MKLTQAKKSRLAFSSYIEQGAVVPAPRNEKSFKCALQSTKSATIILLFGTINSLPDLLKRASDHHKKLFVHFDLLDGIGKDKEGLKLLKTIGVQGIITTKPTIVRYALDEEIDVIQRLFLVDSESIKTGIQFLKKHKPLALEILPASIPRHAIEQLKSEIRVPILGGGLVCTPEDVQAGLEKGLYALSTSEESLW